MFMLTSIGSPLLLTLHSTSSTDAIARGNTGRQFHNIAAMQGMSIEEAAHPVRRFLLKRQA